MTIVFFVVFYPLGEVFIFAAGILYKKISKKNEYFKKKKDASSTFPRAYSGRVNLNFL
ncbi:hypothetical protein RV07_GL001265 [Enterococcus malodoratus]|nr:hypothetical protein RV07_GL001265 [Enterococcus malodoratus]